MPRLKKRNMMHTHWLPDGGSALTLQVLGCIECVFSCVLLDRRYTV